MGAQDTDPDDYAQDGAVNFSDQFNDNDNGDGRGGRDGRGRGPSLTTELQQQGSYGRQTSYDRAEDQPAKRRSSFQKRMGSIKRTASKFSSFLSDTDNKPTWESETGKKFVRYVTPVRGGAVCVPVRGGAVCVPI